MAVHHVTIARGRDVVVDRAGPVPFSVEVSSSRGEAVLVLHGELDLWTHPQFVAALSRVDDGFARVVLDLSDLTYIDAGALGLIHRARKLARSRGADLVLRSPNPHLFRILELSGLNPGVSSNEDQSPIVLPLPSRAYERVAPSA